MNPLNENKFISTKEASELSGYNSDYLARLCREGKIEGTQIGRTWLVSQESLEVFVKAQGERKQELRGQLSEVREKEYKHAQAPIRKVTRKVSPFIDELNVRITKITPKVEHVSGFQKQSFAVLASLIVMLAGVYGAQAAGNSLGNGAIQFALDVSTGLHEIASTAVTKLESDSSNAVASYAVNQNPIRSEEIATSFIPAQFSIVDSIAIPVSTSSQTFLASVEPYTNESDVTDFNFVDAVATAITHPVETSAAVAVASWNAYTGVGAFAYNNIVGLMDAYMSGVQTSGNTSLAVAESVRDTAIALPTALAQSEVHLATTLVALTQNITSAYVGGVYAWVRVTPEIPLAFGTEIYQTGSTIAGVTQNVPAAIASNSNSAVVTASHVAYENLNRNGVSPSHLALLGKSVTDAMHGVRGNTNLALQTVSVSGPKSALAAAAAFAEAVLPAPTYTVGERIALHTYYLIHDFFVHSGEALAGIFGDSRPAKADLAIVPTTALIPAPEASHPAWQIPTQVISPVTNTQTNTNTGSSYPVQIPYFINSGVPQSYVDNAIYNLRGTLLQQIEAAVRPITVNSGGSSSSNSSSGSSFSGVAITGSTFSGGTITSSSFSGGSVSATSLNVSGASALGTLTAGDSTVTGTLTINGDVVVTGNITASNISGGSGNSSGIATTGPYFNATSTTATSTFAGSVNFDNGGFVYATSTRSVGIGSTSPGAALGVAGSGLFTGNVTATDIIATGTATLANAVITNSTTTNATSTNFYSVRGVIDTFVSTLATITNLFVTNSTTTNATTTNLYASNGIIDTLTSLLGSFTNLFATNATTTNATSTNFYATNGIFGNLLATIANFTTAIIGNLTATNAELTNATSTNSTTTNAYVINLKADTGTITNIAGTNATVTNATTTNLGVTNLTGTNAILSAATTTNFYSSLAHIVSGTFDSFTSALATITGLTTTNSTSTNATSTNFFSTTGTFGNITDNGITGDTLLYGNASKQVSSVTLPSYITLTSGTLGISNAAADGTTKGISTFTGSDFNDNGSGLISLDFTNGQKASATQSGFLSSSDWIGFNGKIGSSTISSLVTNFIPKWNGSLFVNSLVSDTGSAVGIGTSTLSTVFGVQGDALFSGDVTAADITATGTANVSALTVGSLTGFLKATAGVVSTSLVDLTTDVTGVLPTTNGGTGISSYSAGQVLITNALGQLVALNPGSNGQVLKLAAGVPTWGLDQTSGGGGGNDGIFATSTNLIYPIDPTYVTVFGSSATSSNSTIFEVHGSSYFSGNVGFGTTSPTYALSVEGQSTLGNRAYAGYFTATSSTASSFPYASSTALSVSGNFYLDSLNGPLQANNGTVSATTSIGVKYGGTGLTTAPSYGNLLVGNSVGGYALTATSSLKIAIADLVGNTDNLTEGVSKLFFTDARADARINATSTIGTLTSAPNLGTVNTALTGFLKATSGVLSTSLITLTSDVTGILPVANGGTGTSSFATNGVIYGNNTGGLLTTAQGAANTVLIANNGAPAFSDAITVGTSVTSPTINATTAFQLNGVSLNTAGTLTNVAYLNQANSFTALNQFFNNASTSQFTATSSTYLATLSGNVGIGTTTPLYKVSIYGGTGSNSYLNIDADAASQSALNFSKAGARKWTLYSPGSSADLRIYDEVAGAPVVSFRQGGNVGIGTTTPTQALSIQGNELLSGNLSAAGITATGTIAFTGVGSGLVKSTSGTLSNVTTSNSSLLVTDGSGNISWSTTLPAVTLGGTVTGNSQTISGLGTLTTSNLTVGTLNGFLKASTGVVSASQFVSLTADVSGILPVANGGTGSTTLSGILIGNGTSAVNTLTIDPTISLTGTTLALNLTNPNTWTGLQQFNANASTTQLTTTGSTYLATTGGSVGVGTTSPATTFAVVGNGYFTGGLGIGQATTSANALTIANGTSGPFYIQGNISTGNVTFNNANNTGGDYNFLSRGSSVLYLKAGGKIGIGTTSPNARLDVAGANNDVTTPLLQLSTVASFATTTQFIVNAAGNTGIGTTSPSAKLAVQGSVIFSGDISGANVNATGTVAFTGIGSGLVKSTSGTLSNVTTSNSSILVTDGSGNISWSTTLPAHTLGGAVTGAGQNITGLGTLTTTNLTVGTLNGFLKASTGVVSASQFVSLTADVSGILPVANGGTASSTPTGILVGNGAGALNTLTIDPTLTLSGSTLALNLTNPNTWTGLQQFNANASTTQLTTTGSTYLATLSGKVGIGTTVPAYPLDVLGFINTDKASGYKQNGNTVLVATSTFHSLFVGTNNIPTLSTSSVGGGSDCAAGSQYGLENIGIGENALQSLTNGCLNVAIGYHAMTDATSSQLDTAIGARALEHTLDAGTGENTALGYNALGANTYGYYNTALGSASQQFNTNGTYNVSVGGHTLLSLLSGSQNAAFGYNALWSATSSSLNTALGDEALSNHLQGDSNASVGYRSLYQDTTGVLNVAVGSLAAYNNSSATNTVAVGYQSQYGISGVYNAQGMTTVGFRTGYSVQTGADYNTLFGYQAGYGLTTGAGNVILGPSNAVAASYNQVTTGSHNIAIGYNVAIPSATTDNQLVIGNYIYGTGLSGTGATVSTSGKIGLGTTTPTQALSIQGNELLSGNLSVAGITATGTIAFTGVGSGLVKSTSGTLSNVTSSNNSILVTDGSGVISWATTLPAFTLGGAVTGAGQNITGLGTLTTTNATITNASTTALSASSAAFGGTATSTFTSVGFLGILTSSPSYALDVAGSINTDQFSGYRQAGNLLAYASSTNQATLFGLQAGGQNATTSATAKQTTAIGYQALNALTTGTQNTAVGALAGVTVSTGSQNSVFGYDTLSFNTTGSDNTAIGFKAGFGSQAGSQKGNTLVGSQAGLNIRVSSDYNTFLGYKAGSTVTTGYGNILLGANVDTATNLTSGGNNIGLGYNLLFPVAANNNQLAIGNILFGTLPATTTASTFTLPTSGSIGVATSSPYGTLSIHAVNGSTNTTLFAIGSSTATATTTLFNILNTGSVGIGTTSPSATLAVQGTGIFSGDLSVANLNATGTVSFAGLTTGLVKSTSGALSNVTSSNNSILVTDGSGNISWGTTLPAHSLGGAVTGLGQNITGLGTLTATNATITNASTTALSAYSAAFGGTATSTFTSAGFLGVGTSSPTSLLSVAGQSYFAGNVGINTQSTSLGLLTVQQSGTETSSSGITLRSITGVITSRFWNDETNSIARWDAGSGGNSNISINGSGAGKVGIGTTSPYALFSINPTSGIGTAPIFIIGSSTGTTSIAVANNSNVGIGTANPSTPLEVAGGAIRITSGVSGLQFTDSSVTITRPVTGRLAFSIGGERLSILSTGFVGIKNTAPTYDLDVTGAGHFTSYVDASYLVATSTTATSSIASNLTIGATNTNYFTNAPLVVTTNTNNYGQAVFQNLSSGTSASTDIILGGNLMTNSSYYGDLGYNSSTNSDANYTGFGVNDLYLYNNDSDLDLAAASSTGNSNIKFFTGGTLAANERLRITSAGNVGIGTTTPGWNFQVAGTRPFSVLTDTSGPIDGKHWFFSSQGGNLYVGSSSDAMTSTSTYLTITAAGNIGIGTTSPQQVSSATNLNAKLAVSGGPVAFQVGNSSVALTLYRSNASAGNTSINYHTVGGDWYGGITQDLNFGFATTQAINTSPKFLLTATGGASLGSTTPYAAFSIANASGLTGSTTLAIRPIASQTANILDLYNTSGTLSTVIDSNGNFGIGSTTPAALLSVGGNGYFTGGLGVGVVNTTAGAIVASGGISTGSRSITSDTVNTGGLWINGRTTASSISGNSNGVALGNSTSWTTLSLYTSAIQRLTIDPGGSTGIGTTTPFATLQIASSTQNSTFRSQLVLTDTNAGTDLKHWGFTSASGNLSIGPITDAYATSTSLTITNAGNIGIANTSPTYKLDVTGLGHFTGLVDAANFVATSTTATSTLAGGLSVGNNAAFVVNQAASANSLYINPSGEVGFGTQTPTAKLHIAGTYTTANTEIAKITTTFVSSNTGTQAGLLVNPSFNPSGGSAGTEVGIYSAPNIASAATVSPTNYYGFLSAPALGASFTGTVVTGMGYVAFSPTLNGANPITNFTGYHVSAITNGNASTTGTITNRGLNIAAATAAAAGGTINNYGAQISVPTGSATAGTNNNRALYITGNGGTAAGGTVSNYAIYSDSTSDSYYAGSIGVGSTSPFAKVAIQGAGATTGVNFQTTNSSQTPLFTVYDSGAVGIGTTSQTVANTLTIKGGTLFSTTTNSNPNVASLRIVPNGTSAMVAFGGFTADAASGGNQATIQAGNAATAATVSSLLLNPLGGAVGIGTYATGAGYGAISTNNALAISGGTVIGNDYWATSAPSNGLLVQGSVGVGSTSPTATFAVQGNGTFSTGLGIGLATTTGVGTQGTLALFNGTGGAFYIQGNGATGNVLFNNLNTVGGDFNFQSRGQPLIYFKNGGNIGISTTSPGARLDVVGAVNDVTTPLFQLSSAVTGATTTQMIVTAAGSVGIGTSTPLTLLDVNGTGHFATSVTLGSANAGVPTAGTLAGYAATAADTAGSNLFIDAGNGTGTGGSGSLVFRTAASNGGGVSTITLDSTSNSNSGTVVAPGTPANITWGHTIGSGTGRILIVTVSMAMGSSGSVDHITFGTQSLTKLTSTSVGTVAGTTGAREEVWYLVNPAVGTSNITVIFAGTAARVAVGGVSYTGVDQTTPFNSAATTVSSATTGTPSVTVSSNTNELVFDAIAWRDSGKIATSSASQTTLINATTTNTTQSNNVFLGVTSQAGAASVAMQWNATSTAGYAYVATSIRPGGSSGGDTLAERLRINSSGLVGIGTSTPYSTFSVWGADTAATQLFSLVNNASSTIFQALNNGNIGVGSTTPWGQFSINPNGITGPAFVIGSSTKSLFIVQNDGRTSISTSTTATTTSPSTLTVNGSFCVTNNTTPKAAGDCGSAPGNIYYATSNTGNYDVAENYITLSAQPAGTLVGLDLANPGYVATSTLSHLFLGVVSTAPGLVLGGADGETLANNVTTTLALSGRVPVKVNLDGGPISIGDRLMLSSSTPGVAMKAQHSGQTIGIALDSYDGTSATSTISMFVQSEYWFSQDDLSINSGTGDTTFGSASSARNLQVYGDITSMGSTTSFAFIVPATPQTFTIGSTSVLVTLPAEVLTLDGQHVDVYKLATYALASVQNLVTTTNTLATRIDSLNARITALENIQIATSSQTASVLDSGFSTSTLVSALENMGVLLGRGIAQFNTLVVRNLVFSKDTSGTSAAGNGTILAGNTVLEISNDHMLASSQVSITFTSSVQGSWYVSNKSDGSFRVNLSQAQSGDVTFDYFIVQTEGQIASSTPNGPDTGGFSFSAWLAGLLNGSSTSSTSSGSSSSSSTSSGSTSVSTSTPSTTSNSPHVTLNGDPAISLNQGDVFIDPGATAVDASSTDITSSITVSGSVDTSTAGTYTLTYTATDAAGNTGSASRVVSVTAAATTPDTSASDTPPADTSSTDTGSTTP